MNLYLSDTDQNLQKSAELLTNQPTAAIARGWGGVVSPSLRAGKKKCAILQTNTLIHTRSLQGMLPEPDGLLGLWRMGSPTLNVEVWLQEEVRAMKRSF